MWGLMLLLGDAGPVGVGVTAKAGVCVRGAVISPLCKHAPPVAVPGLSSNTSAVFSPAFLITGMMLALSSCPGSCAGAGRGGCG